MGLSVQFSDNEDTFTYSLATANGWGQASEWVAQRSSLSALKQFCSEGGCEGTRRLAEDLAAALEQEMPPDVRSTLSGLANNMGVGADDETATVVSE